MQAASQARAGGWRQLAAVLTTLVLAACATAPPPAPTPPRPDVVSRPGPPPVATPPPAPRGGGYYKDDGPGDAIPPNLDEIPDAVPRREPIRAANSRPYVALGQSFTPMTELQPYKAQGIASWYGKKFHGAKTSSGEAYDMYAMTAAHPTLPIPSYARVTNLDTGKSVIVRVNDRGPFHKDRLIDLSYTAAHKLGYVGKGSTRVEVESIIPDGVEVVATRRPVPPVSTPVSRQHAAQAAQSAAVAAAAAPATPNDGSLAERILNGEAPPSAEQLLRSEPPLVAVPPAAAVTAEAKGVFLQLGAFNTTANAESFRDYVTQELKGLAEALSIHADGQRYRLQLGPFSSHAEARQRAESISQRLKFKPFVIVR